MSRLSVCSKADQTTGSRVRGLGSSAGSATDKMQASYSGSLDLSFLL